MFVKGKLELDGSECSAGVEGDYASDDSKYSPIRKAICKQLTPRAYDVCTSHSINVNLREQYGLEAISRVKGN